MCEPDTLWGEWFKIFIQLFYSWCACNVHSYFFCITVTCIKYGHSWYNDYNEPIFEILILLSFRCDVLWSAFFAFDLSDPKLMLLLVSVHPSHLHATIQDFEISFHYSLIFTFNSSNRRKPYAYLQTVLTPKVFFIYSAFSPFARHFTIYMSALFQNVEVNQIVHGYIILRFIKKSIFVIHNRSLNLAIVTRSTRLNKSETPIC